MGLPDYDWESKTESVIATHKKMFGMQSKIDKNRRSHQPGHTQENAYPRQFHPHSFPGDKAKGQQKAQAKEAETEKA